MTGTFIGHGILQRCTKQLTNYFYMKFTYLKKKRLAVIRSNSSFFIQKINFNFNLNFDFRFDFVVQYQYSVTVFNIQNWKKA